MRGARLLLCLLAAGSAPAADWAPPDLPAGSFPMLRSFEGTFRFGWSGLTAARAHATFRIEGSTAKVSVRGGTTGLARDLWRLDAEHDTAFAIDGIRPLQFQQTERYARRTIATRAEFDTDGVRRLRQTSPGPHAKWKTVRLPGLRDLVAAMFAIRSQPLTPDSRFELLAFPGDAPFLVAIHAATRETISLDGTPRQAIRLDFRLNRLRIEKNQPPALEPHAKFRRGSVWISDDADRIPLRAEVHIFIGSIFGELESLRWLPHHTSPAVQ